MYKELVSPPKEIRVIFSLIIAVVFYFVPLPLLLISLPNFNPTLSTVLIELVVLLIAYGILSISYGVSLKVSRRRMFDGTKHGTLRIKGTRKDLASYIPCRDITDMEIVDFGKKIESQPENFSIFKLVGYKGSGLSVTFSYASLTNANSQKLTLVFPTHHPSELIALLKAEATATG